MNANLLKEVEDIHTRTFGQGARTIGVTSPQTQSGVSTLAKSLAKRCASSGQKALLMDISREADDPFVPNEADLIGKTSNGQEIWRTSEGYDILALNPAKGDQYGFRDARELQEMLKSELEGYQQIVVDLPQVPNTDNAPVPGSVLESAPNGVGAAACDAVVLVCRTYAVTRAAIETAVKNLTKNDAKIAGLVMNDQNAPTLQQEMLKEFSRKKWFLPKSIRRYLEKKSSPHRSHH
ncbi:MAG: hypothetical protein ABJN24_11985 [Hyphomicrobiales bacterium]